MRFKYNQFFLHGEGLREVHYLPAIEEEGERRWRIVEWRIVDRRRGIFEKIEVFFWQYERDIKTPRIVITSNNK